MLNEATASRLLETTNSAFERIRNQQSDGEPNSTSDLRNYRIKLAAEKHKQQSGRATMEFKLQEQTQEIEELKLVNLQYQTTIKTVTSKNREFRSANQRLIEKCNQSRTEAPDSKKALKRLLDENVDINANNVKRTPDRESAKSADAERDAQKKDEQIAKLRSHNANLLKEKDELTKKGERFKAAYNEFKRSYEDLRIKYEEVREEKTADLIKDPRITKKISSEKDLKIEQLTKLNLELQEELQKQAARAASSEANNVKKERGAEFDQRQPPDPAAAASSEADQQKIKQHEAKIKKLEESKGILEDSLRKKDSSLVAKENDIKKLTDDLEAMKNRFSKFNVDKDGLQSQLKEDKTRITELEKDIQSLKEQHQKDLKNAAERLEKERQQTTSNHQRELANQRTKAEANLNQQLAKVKSEFEAKIETLKSELEKKQQYAGDPSKANKELDRLKTELTTKDSEVERYKLMYEKANENLQQKQFHINELTRSHNDLQKSNIRLERLNVLLEEKVAAANNMLNANSIIGSAAQYAGYMPMSGPQQSPGGTFVPSISTPVPIQSPPNSSLSGSRNSPMNLQRAALNQQNMVQQQQQQQQQQQNLQNASYLAHHLQQQRNGKPFAQALVIQQQQQSASPRSPSLNQQQQIPARVPSGMTIDQIQAVKSKLLEKKSPSPSGRDSDKK